MEPLSPVDAQLAHLVTVAWILLIPIGVLLALLLYKLVLLLQAVLELSTIAKYEVYPMVQEMREIVGRTNVLSSKVTSGVQSVEKTLHSAKPALQKGGVKTKAFFTRLKEAGQTLVDGVGHAIFR